MVRHGEAVGVNQEATEEFMQEFGDYVKTEGFLLQQVFNCDKTSLFRKKMARRTYWLDLEVSTCVST